jgi:hypothetical protein
MIFGFKRKCYSFYCVDRIKKSCPSFCVTLIQLVIQDQSILHEVVLGAQRTGFGRTRHIGGIGRTADSAHFSSLKLPQPKKNLILPQKVKNLILPQKVKKGQKSYFAPKSQKSHFPPKSQKMYWTHATHRWYWAHSAQRTFFKSQITPTEKKSHFPPKRSKKVKNLILPQKVKKGQNSHFPPKSQKKVLDARDT